MQLVEKLRSATNILVTVSNNPSVDQLSACIGMTLWLNKLGKHSTAVFSGNIPNTLEFLQPESTIEKNTDSLRDFIIALDRSKADKLRYKVEDRVVKIFITPYRTSLSADDLEFSQGDFNVDAIVALGVNKQSDLDQAITAHGRILHDAVVTSINTTDEEGLGSINYHDSTASSLSEMVYDVCKQLDAKQIDPQIATALLTGVVAATDRFSNQKTTPTAMSISAELMGAGANQQLVANKLEGDGSVNPGPKLDSNIGQTGVSTDKPVENNGDGRLVIEHEDAKPANEPAKVPTPNVAPPTAATEDNQPPKPDNPSGRMVMTPPTIDGTFNANTQPEETAIKPLSNDQSDQPQESADLLSHQPLTPITNETQPDSAAASVPQPPPGPGFSPQQTTDNSNTADTQTLSEIEQAVDSPHLKELKDRVDEALNSAAETQSPQSQNGSTSQSESTQFNPANFGLDQSEAEDVPPEVPPPIVPPNFLPPNPPS